MVTSEAGLLLDLRRLVPIATTLKYRKSAVSSVKFEKTEDLLVIYVTEAKILNEAGIQRIYKDIIEVIEKTEQPNVIIDFQCVQFMSSAALGMLVRIHKKCKEFAVVLKLCNICAEIRKVFEITRLDKVLDIYDDPKEAVASFKAKKKKKGFFGKS
jgi:anti-anti-sigma factor